LGLARTAKQAISVHIIDTAGRSPVARQAVRSQIGFSDRLLGLWIITGSILIGSAGAWHGQGHIHATSLAVLAVQDHLPPFFAEGIETIKHCSVDPDVFKFRTDETTLYRTEAPDHYFDLERFDGNDLPDTRQDFTWWCVRKGRSTSYVGTLPYAVTEWTYRLCIALAEYRRWPDNPAIQTKCLVYAGILAHYAEDACMPLHATIHWDGRANENGNSPHTGIHSKVDALLQKVTAEESPILGPDETAFDSVLDAIFAQLHASNQLVDAVYELENTVPEVDQPINPQSPLWTFMQERLRETSLFTARLFVTAFQKSTQVEIPEWHVRAPTQPVP